MADPIVPKPGGNSKLMHDPKRRRMILAIAAGGALALIFLLSRNLSGGASASATTDQGIDPATGVPYADELAAAQSGAMPSSFADNGGQAAALGDSVTSGLQGLQDTLASGLQNIQDTLGQNAGGAGSGSGAGSGGTPQVTVNLPAPGQLAASGQPTGAPTSAGFHAGHSRGHEYYIPGVGWVSKARFDGWKKGGSGSGPSGSGPAAPTATGGAPQTPPPATSTAPGFHAGHSAGHEYYIPSFGWVSKQRYQGWQKTGVAK